MRWSLSRLICEDDRSRITGKFTLSCHVYPTGTLKHSGVYGRLHWGGSWML